MHSGGNARPGLEQQFKEGKQSKIEFIPDARPGLGKNHEDGDGTKAQLLNDHGGSELWKYAPHSQMLAPVELGESKLVHPCCQFLTAPRSGNTLGSNQRPYLCGWWQEMIHERTRRVDYGGGQGLESLSSVCPSPRCYVPSLARQVGVAMSQIWSTKQTTISRRHGRRYTEGIAI